MIPIPPRLGPISTYIRRPLLARGHQAEDVGTECNHRSSVSVLCLSSGIGDSCLEISGQLSGHLWLAVLGPGTPFSPSLVRSPRILGPPWKSV